MEEGEVETCEKAVRKIKQGGYIQNLNYTLQIALKDKQRNVHLRRMV